MAKKSNPTTEPTRTQVSFRMLNGSIERLDELCTVNKRSRREIIEILVDEAHGVYTENPNDRINPL